MKVKELLAKPENWTKRVLARDADGIAVAVESERAKSFCLLGALLRCYPDYESRMEAEDRLLKVMRTRGLNSGIAQYNDFAWTTHQDILDLVEAADV